MDETSILLTSSVGSGIGLALVGAVKGKSEEPSIARFGDAKIPRLQDHHHAS